jgi:hypothetical protein
MSAYTHRLLKHLLSGISPEWQFSSLVPTQRTGQTLVTSSANPNPNPNPIPSSISSVNGSGSGSGSGSQAHAQVQHQSSATWAATSAQEIIQDHLWNQHDPKFSFGTMSSTFQNATFPVDPDTIAGMQPQPNTHSDDVLFPAADDEFWWVGCGRIGRSANEYLGACSSPRLTGQRRCEGELQVSFLSSQQPLP